MRVVGAPVGYGPRRYPLAVRPIACATNRLGGIFWRKPEAMADSKCTQRYPAGGAGRGSTRELSGHQGVVALSGTLPRSSPHLESAIRVSLAHTSAPAHLPCPTSNDSRAIPQTKESLSMYERTELYCHVSVCVRLILGSKRRLPSPNMSISDETVTLQYQHRPRLLFTTF